MVAAVFAEVTSCEHPLHFTQSSPWQTDARCSHATEYRLTSGSGKHEYKIPIDLYQSQQLD